MKRVVLLHNPGAGEAKHPKEVLVDAITRHGYKCLYQSVKKKPWRPISLKNTDLVVIAGGDGTVRRVVNHFNRHSSLYGLPVALLPLGTANNIATTLDLPKHLDTSIASWKEGTIRSFDVSRVMADKPRIMTESFGAGLFASHIQNMMKHPNPETASPADRMAATLRRLLDDIDEQEPVYFFVGIDGKDHSGYYLMVEIMNTPFIGTNLRLSPAADPGDGLLNVVLIRARDRERLLQYVGDKMNGIERPAHFTCHKGREIRFRAATGPYHVDDKLLEFQPDESASISCGKEQIHFLV